ncbi:MAG: hypothetical protein ABI091_27740 [Ferruginibacter sp.]
MKKYFCLILLCSFLVSCSSFDNLSNAERSKTRKLRKTNILFIAHFVDSQKDSAILFIFREKNFFEQLESIDSRKQKYFYGSYMRSGDSIVLNYKSVAYLSQINKLYWNTSSDTLNFYDSNYFRRIAFPVRYKK